MTTSRTTYTLALALVAATTVNAQNALKDGTTLQWDKESAAGMDALRAELRSDMDALRTKVAKIVRINGVVA